MYRSGGGVDASFWEVDVYRPSDPEWDFPGQGCRSQQEGGQTRDVPEGPRYPQNQNRGGDLRSGGSRGGCHQVKWCVGNKLLYPPQMKFGRYIGITLFVCLSVRLSVQRKFNLGYNFWTKRDMAFIFSHVCSLWQDLYLCTKNFDIVTLTFDLLLKNCWKYEYIVWIMFYILRV